MRIRAQWVFIGLAVIVVIAGIIWGFVVVQQRKERVAAMTKRLNELRLEARARKVPRTVLRGERLPGKAWEEYTIAIKDSESWTEDPLTRNLERFLNDKPDADRALVDRMLASHAAALDHLRLGAQRVDGQYPYQWEDGEAMEMPSLLGARNVSKLAVVQSRVLMEDGRTQEAIDMILDTLMFARDVGSNGPLLPTLVGDAVYSLTFDEIRRLLSSGKLTPSQLAELENKLQIVDRDFPSLATAMANDNLSLGMAVINGNEAGGSMREWVALAVQGGWRYGFSTKHMALDAFEERESHLRRAQAAEGFVNAKSREEIRAIESSGAASVNPMVQQLMPSYAKSDEAHREVLARLRLLRAVVGFLRTGTVPQIDDPFGTHILHSQNGGKTKIWSVGINEKDDGGIGSWSHDRPADIVIEMQK